MEEFKVSIPTQEQDIEGGNIDINDNNSQGNDVNIVYPAAEVRIEKAQFSILHLQTLCKKRKELIIDPEFQRNKVWDNKQASELIESILMGIPIPLMYLFEDKTGKKQVVDGRQRITAILDFLENKFKLSNLKILSSLNDCKFTDLELKLQGVFEDYQLLFYIIQPPTPERIKYDIFDRVNRGGTTLNKQEMRNALYRGKATKLIDEISESSQFSLATNDGISPKRMKDRYVVLRSMAFLMLRKGVFNDIREMEYRSDIDDFLARFMTYINNDASDELIHEYKELFLKAMVDSFTMIGGDGFRFTGTDIRRPINMPLFEVLTYFFTFDYSSGISEKISLSISELKEEFDKSGLFRSNVDSSTSVDYRFERVDLLIKNLQQND